jgi:hypothetical protein
MTPRPISLSSAQLASVMSAARSLPTEWRGRFLDSIADHLLAAGEITDAAVEIAIAGTLSRIMGAAA